MAKDVTKLVKYVSILVKTFLLHFGMLPLDLLGIRGHKQKVVHSPDEKAFFALCLREFFEFSLNEAPVVDVAEGSGEGIPLDQATSFQIIFGSHSNAKFQNLQFDSGGKHKNGEKKKCLRRKCLKN